MIKVFETNEASVSQDESDAIDRNQDDSIQSTVGYGKLDVIHGSIGVAHEWYRTR